MTSSYEDHLDFLCGLTRLQLWFIRHWLDGHPGETFREVLRQRVDIHRKTIYRDGHMFSQEPFDFEQPGWRTLVSKLEAIDYDTRGEPPEAFEAAAWQVLQPLVEPRAEQDLGDLSIFDRYQCGSLSYDEKLMEADRGLVNFHIMNRLAPRSIFDDPGYLANCLRELMKETTASLGACCLSTDTWLNEYPKWLRLFPRPWHDGLTLPNRDIGWTFRFWGQFMNARGAFNHKLGEQFRRTGRMPYLPRRGWCTFEELRRQLDENFPTTSQV